MSWLRNIYAPPIAGAGAGQATRGRAELFAAAATLCGAIFGGLLFSALVMRIASLQPAGLLPADWYNVVFSLHGGMAFAFANGLKLLLLAAWSPIEARESLRSRLFLAALAIVGLETVGAVGLSFLEAPLWVSLVALWAPASAVAVCLVWAALISVRTDPAPALVLLFAAVATVAMRPADDSTFLLCVLALPSSSSRQHGDGMHERPYSGTSRIFLALSALLAFLGLTQWAPGALSVLWVLAAACWVVVLWKRLSLPVLPEVRWSARAGLALFSLALMLRLFLVVLSFESFLEDTLLAVAVHHVTVFGLTFLALAVAFNEFRGLRSSLGMRLAIASSLVGALAFVWFFAILGVRGMPRRYMTYLPEFVGLQVAATIAALIFAAGFAVIALGVLRRRGHASFSP